MPRYTRTAYVQRLAELVGDPFRIDNPNNGWPALCAIQVEREWVSCAIHVGLVIESHRNRDVERRIENPGQHRPVQRPPGTLPLILGVWEEDGDIALVAFDAIRRINQETRKSMFMKLDRLRTAARTGWAEDVSASGEQIYFFEPVQLSTYVELVLSRQVAADLPTEAAVAIS